MVDEKDKLLVANRDVSPLAPASSLSERAGRRTRTVVWCIILLVWIAAFFDLGADKRRSSRPSVPPAGVNPELMWNELPSLRPSDLQWEKCYADHFECARMAVPLDYAHPSVGFASIALIKYPAKVPTDHKEYKGPILIHPGGAGMSGVSYFQRIGPMFQELLGQEYDIVSWDARGIGRTTPQVQYFPDNAEGLAFRMRLQDDPVANTSADAISRIHARYTTLSGIAKERTSKTSPYVTTALVARDMLSIVRAFGREKLQYWGFSYGTTVGATFAAMFPDHIERMILDGVIDTKEYFTGRWEKYLSNADEVFRTFAKGCVAAGLDNCGLYESTPDEVLSRLHKLLEDLKQNPVLVPISESPSNNYGLVDYKVVKNALALFAYAPYGTAGPFLAAIHLSSSLAELEKGNGAPIWAWLSLTQERFECTCPKQPQEPDLITPHADQAITCGDSGQVNDTVQDLKDYFVRASAISAFADILWPRALCLGWKLPAAERFTGPFVGNTSHPILIIGNSYDPVAPLASAEILSKGFPGSVVLQQNSVGHCSLAASSACTAKHVRAYFRNGELPPRDTVCEVESSMFGVPPSILAEEYDGEERVVVRAWRQLAASIRVPVLGMSFAGAVGRA